MEWITVRDYENLMKFRDISSLPGDLANPYYCAQGLCLLSSYATLNCDSPIFPKLGEPANS